MNIIIEEIVSEIPVLITEEVFQITIADATSYFDLIEVADTDFVGKDGFVPVVDEATGKLVLQEQQSGPGGGLQLGETSSTAYRGDRGKTAYDHSQVNGNPHGTTAQQVGAYTKTETDNLLANINTDALFRITVKLSENISKGQAVYISSANGTNIIVSKASNATEATSSKVIGLLETTGVTNDIVKVITDGFATGLNTSSATIGDAVWLGTSGNLIFGLSNKPVAPAHLVYIGVVSRVHATQGEILVKVQNGFELKEIHDILITSLIDKQFLCYDEVTGLWKNKSITSTDLDALKRDGSNANSDVDIDTYSLKAKSVFVGGTDKMELRGDFLGTNRTAQWQNKDYDAIADMSDVTDALATFKTTEYLDATSSIQGQLDSKQPILPYTPYKFVQTSQALHTGTTSETIVATETISGGVFNANDSMKALFKCTKVTSTSNVIMRLRINTTNSLSGSVQIATLTLTTANVYGKMNRTFDLNGGNLYGYNFSSSLATDNTATNTTSGSTAYNTANTLYFFWTVQLGTAIDSVTPNLANLTN